MGIAVNGVEIDDGAIEQELPYHTQADNPLKQAVHELVLRTLLLQQADVLAIAGNDPEERIAAVLERQVKSPTPDEAACRTYYLNNTAKYSSGDMVEARHILFQVTPQASLELLRATAEAVLEELKLHPERFGELAGAYSNCSSGAVGGSLGQLSRGQSVPEFEDLVFRMAPGEMSARLLETRFGLHIVQVVRKIEGKVLPFEAVQSEIAAWLERESSQRAMHQYLHILVGHARIEGMEMEGADSPLVQ